MIEAAASGLPIVVTGWSGHLEFLEKGLFGSVDYELAEISETRVDNRIFEKGFMWAEPKEESFKLEIRNVYKDYKNAKKKATSLKAKIWLNYNSKKIKNAYSEVFNGLMEK